MLERFAEARLLIVDDDASAVARLRTGLTRAGFKFVFTEADPRQALSVVPEVDPDLISLDLQMRQLHGFAVLEATSPLRSGGPRRRVREAVTNALRPANGREKGSPLVGVLVTDHHRPGRRRPSHRRHLRRPSASQIATVPTGDGKETGRSS